MNPLILPCYELNSTPALGSFGIKLSTKCDMTLNKKAKLNPKKINK